LSAVIPLICSVEMIFLENSTSAPHRKNNKKENELSWMELKTVLAFGRPLGAEVLSIYSLSSHL